MNAIQRGRLMKLANHLLHGKLGHKKWDFSTLNDGTGVYDKKGCGTAGCALGECPIVFPRQWIFDKNFLFQPRLKQGSDAFLDASDFFGIEMKAVYHLFDPTCQKPQQYGGKFLGWKATRKQVASNILAFLKKMDKKERNSK